MGARWIAVVLAASSLFLAGCGNTQAGKLPTPTSTAKAVSVKLTDGKETFLVATAKQDQGIFFTRPPYDMHGPWRCEVTCGIYKPAALTASTGTVFGLESDLRGPTKTPTEFYGCYAKYFTTPTVGMQVFATSHAGNIGQTFFNGATSVDLALETNGTTVTYLARDSAVGGAYTTVGTRTLSSPSGAHQPGFGMFQALKGSTIGFTNFRVPLNTPAALPISPEQDAMNGVYEAALIALNAVYAVNVPAAGAPEATVADGFVTQAQTSLAAARAKIAGLSEKAPPTPKSKALAAVDKAAKALTAAHNAFVKKGIKEAAPFVKTASTKLFTAAWHVTDALIPDDLRAALPGNGLGK